jgi:ribonuclease Z
MELRPGRWLDELKRSIRDRRPDDHALRVTVQRNGTVTEEDRTVGDLRPLVMESSGQKIGYVVDTLFNDDNRKKIVELVAGADVFYCEAPFLNDDEDQATKRYHLTARQAGILGREARVRRLEVFHFSPRYEGQAERIYAEAKASFRGEL